MSSFELFLCGDVMTGRGLDQILPAPSSPELYEDYIRDARDYVELAERSSGVIERPVDFGYPWGDALEELARAAPAARIVNLETAVTQSQEAWPDKGINYRMHPANVPCLSALGPDVCVLSNNHVLDWGHAGLVETIECLRSARLGPVGAGLTLADAEAPVIVPIAGGGRVVVFGVGERSSGIPRSWAATPHRPGIALLRDLGEAEALAIGARAERARRAGDVVIVSIHWGTNWGYEVEGDHVRFAHALVDAGIDVVHGHSSHHPRPVEVHAGRPILYGCGDFMNDYEGIGGHEAFRADIAAMYFLRFERTGRGPRFVALRIVPMRVRRMRLERGTIADGEAVASISLPFGTAMTVRADGSRVSASWSASCSAPGHENRVRLQ